MDHRAIEPTALDRCRAVLLDVDNTLYAPATGLLARVDVNITSYVALALGLPEEEANRTRVAYTREFGTTLGWLIARDGVDPEHYHQFIYDFDVRGFVSPRPELAEMLSRLRVPAAVLTNADRRYACRVLEALGVRDHIWHVVDIESAGYRGKPRLGFYVTAAQALGLRPDECLLVEDTPRNIAAARALGMPTVYARWGHTRATPSPEGPVIDDITELESVVPDLFDPAPNRHPPTG